MSEQPTIGPRSDPHRVAVVTGGSGGIGRAVAERLAADGMAVTVHYAGNKDRADETVAAITAAGGTATALGGDVADLDDMTALFDQVETLFGGVDVVVNTAGIMLLGPVAQFDLDAFDRMQRTNVRGSFVVAQQAAARLRAGGALITFSTSQTLLRHPGYAAYASTKAAVEAMTLVLARELSGRDITVNSVAPGPTDTPLFRDGKSADVLDRIAGLSPMQRLGEPTDIAEVVAHLAGPARWINGQTVFVNGGVA